MGLLSTIVGGVFSLFGANKARKDEQAAIAAQNAYNHPKAIRARAEEAGVHPSVFFGPGVGNQTAVGGTNYMGAAIADAGLMVADQLSKNSAAQKLERTERLNSKLQQQVTDLTIRPKVGGIYDQRVATPTVRQALGVPDAQSDYSLGTVSPDGVSGSSRPDLTYGLEDLRDTDPADPRRAVDHKPVATHSGWMAVDNPTLGRMWFPTLDGDEAMSLGEYPTAAYGFATRERGIGGRALEYIKTGDFDWSFRGPRTSDIQANLDYLSNTFKAATKPPKRKGRDYWTHPQTGFSAPRVSFGFH